MLAGLTGHIYLIDSRESMTQFLPVRFVSTLYGTAIGWDFTVSRWDSFHLGRDGQEVVLPVMADVGAAPCDATWREKGKIDLARVNGILKDRGTDEDWARAIRLCVNR